MAKPPSNVQDWLKAMKESEPELSKLAPKPVLDEVNFTECACGKIKPVVELTKRSSGVVTFVDNVCAGCEMHSQGLATIICVKCRRVLGRVKPLKDKLGFEFKAGRVYHVEYCPKCVPGTKKAVLIEMILFYRKIGFKHFITSNP